MLGHGGALWMGWDSLCLKLKWLLVWLLFVCLLACLCCVIEIDDVGFVWQIEKLMGLFCCL